MELWGSAYSHYPSVQSSRPHPRSRKPNLAKMRCQPVKPKEKKKGEEENTYITASAWEEPEGLRGVSQLIQSHSTDSAP